MHFSILKLYTPREGALLLMLENSEAMKALGAGDKWRFWEGESQGMRSLAFLNLILSDVWCLLLGAGHQISRDGPRLLHCYSFQMLQLLA